LHLWVALPSPALQNDCACGTWAKLRKVGIYISNKAITAKSSMTALLWSRKICKKINKNNTRIYEYTKYDIRNTVYDIRYTIYGIRYTLYVIRYTKYHIRYTIYDIRNTNYEIFQYLNK
jgi:hypothetical protein